MSSARGAEGFADAYPTGTHLGRYEIAERIHVGGMATVYRARRAPDGQTVALKIPHGAAKPKGASLTRSRAQREARIAARVAHPACVRILGVESEGDLSFLVMEYLSGVDLARHLAASGSLSIADTVAILQPVIRVLASAHDKGIVHMDIKPANIMVLCEGRSSTGKLLDFGIATVTDEPPRKGGAAEQVFGTLRYMSPERLQDHAAIDPRSDQFSVGLVLYECLTGRLPFGDLPAEALLESITKGPRQSVRELRPDVPVELDAVIRRALRPSPDERYGIIEAMGDAIAAAPVVSVASARSEPFSPTPLPTIHTDQTRPRAPPAGRG